MLSNNLTVSSLINHLSKKYNVLGAFRATDITKNGNDYGWMYSALKKIKKDRFQPLDRIVFIFYDTDYYFNFKHNLNLYNIQTILNELNIPTFCCLFVTQQEYLKQNTNEIQNEYFPHDQPIKVAEVYIDHGIVLKNLSTQVKLNVDLIEKPILFLNNKNRKHRQIFFSLLIEHAILDLCYCSFLAAPIYSSDNFIKNSNDIETINCNPNLITTKVSFNESWPITDNKTKEIYEKFLPKFTPDYQFKNFIEPDMTTTEKTVNLNYNLFQSCFLYTVSETVIAYPGPFVTEKSLKGIATMRPFVILGPQGNLRKLKEYGFKTFDSWWDEQYDEIENPNERLLAVFKIVQDISLKSVNELKEICKDMSEVLHYNYHHLHNNFIPNQLELLDKQCSE